VTAGPVRSSLRRRRSTRADAERDLPESTTASSSTDRDAALSSTRLDVAIP